MWVGFAILGASCLLIAAVTAVAARRWKSKEPTEWHVVGLYRVGVAYEENAVRPWLAARGVITALEWFDNTEKPLTFFVRVFPEEASLRVNRKPFATGTVRVERFMGLFRPMIVVCVRQRRDPSGAVLDARRSALIHEVCEHVWPWVREREWNWPEPDGSHSERWKKGTRAVKDFYDQTVG